MAERRISRESRKKAVRRTDTTYLTDEAQALRAAGLMIGVRNRGLDQPAEAAPSRAAFHARGVSSAFGVTATRLSTSRR